MSTTANLKKEYAERIAPALKEKFHYTSSMQIPVLKKIVINQGMGILGVDSNYQKVVKGIVLLVAVMFDVLSKRQKR